MVGHHDHIGVAYHKEATVEATTDELPLAGTTTNEVATGFAWQAKHSSSSRS